MEHRKADIMQGERNCAHCNYIFKPVNIREVLCSNDCKKAVRNAKAKMYREKVKHDKAMTKTCVVCGTGFKSASKRKITCTPACQTARNSERENSRQRTLRIVAREAEQAQAVVESIVGDMSRAITTEGLDQAFTATSKDMTKSLQLLKNALVRKLIIDAYEEKALAVSKGFAAMIVAAKRIQQQEARNGQ